jgi:aminopeptidase N
MAARRAELDQHDPAAVQALLDADPDPDAHVKRLRVLAGHPHAESKEEVWRAFFVDRAVPASRETLELGAVFWRPQQAEMLAPFALRYLDELRTLTGGLLNQGVVIRGMYPLGSGNEEFLEAARKAAEDPAISAYGRNQLHAHNFVLGRILAARRL